MATHSSILAWETSLAGSGSRGHKEWDMTERARTHTCPLCLASRTAVNCWTSSSLSFLCCKMGSPHGLAYPSPQVPVSLTGQR